METKLYAAYGSNLHLGQMAARCPGAKPLGTGVIKGCVLQFKGRPGCAHATIARREGAEVPVAVWELTASDEANLDRYEGYPSYYLKQEVTVRMGEKEVAAMAYVMDLTMGFDVPAPGYYRTIREGYRDLGFDPDILDQAVRESRERLIEAAEGVGAPGREDPDASEAEETEDMRAPGQEEDGELPKGARAGEELSGPAQGMA